MPEISRFFGIVIKKFFDDHNPPHFHAEYGGDLALVDIRADCVFQEVASLRERACRRVGDTSSARTSH
jgi:hypothetical protein